MANVFGILTAITLALAAFVAYKNKSSYTKVVATTIVARDKLSQSEIRLAEAEKVLAALPTERAGVDAEADELLAQEAKSKGANEEAKPQVGEKTAKIAANKQQLDEIRQKTEKTGDLKGLAAILRTTNAELEELSQSISTSEAQLANLIAQRASSESQVTTARSQLESFVSGQSMSNMKTRIRSIYPSWGFVTLAGGNNVGVVANSVLNVIRNGQTIAMLSVTAVESNSASASIIPDSLEDDVTLMVGDLVVPGLKPARATASN
ncbi:MAG: hypothetical protein WED15_02710 [Akkermansiaceae bacterium]